ncbi:hypothetical protein A2837_02220 [Candidatus Kaiserbacteria bacterium RIFCSPHIGHO2_01_FULL_46_22]|uniref:Uncharacterized protein n=1 Tax=Candidatus Kaiserbacteria bacterium RIFCSPHIGHO2_01_FULL_46_22 TaxID=1798475 RepID=A0A1F6BYG4_9BACT|nr:MAG: hypothetical protein A2837_02220 [Candidatus Kaiserbacteria bacterium RIFCSPHIGHO2_01_FULL_46_22]
MSFKIPDILLPPFGSVKKELMKAWADRDDSDPSTWCKEPLRSGFSYHFLCPPICDKANTVPDHRVIIVEFTTIDKQGIAKDCLIDFVSLWKMGDTFQHNAIELFFTTHLQPPNRHRAGKIRPYNYINPENVKV